MMISENALIGKKMKVVSLLFLIILGCQDSLQNSNLEVDVNSFKNSPLLVKGTPEREEWEYKIAFTPPPSVSQKVFYNILRGKIKQSWKNEKWKFAELVGSSYYSKEEPRTYLYQDIYFDTKNYELYKNHLSYRLRYRFKSLSSSTIHEYLPFLKKHWPIRCEIQFKNSQSLSPSNKVNTFLETRFEFRNASLPFLTSQDAPPSPWPLQQYLSYAQQGRFNNYLISPMASLIKYLNPESNIMLNPVLRLKTPRTRWHIEISNPFGQATNNPNPNNAFFITWDDVQDGLPPTSSPFIEVEVEADRSSLDEVQDRRVKINTKEIELAIKADQMKIYTLVLQTLAELNVNILTQENKYHRIMSSFKN